MTHDLVTTAFTLEGYRIVQNLGLVRGIVVRSRSIFGTIGAGLQTIVGGNITLLTELCEKTRSQAFETMVQHSTELGGNAIIGTRYDATVAYLHKSNPDLMILRVRPDFPIPQHLPGQYSSL